MTFVIDILLLAMLAATAITITRLRSLFAAAMLTGVYSFLSACWMTALDAVDVAFTEAAVGAGISTVIMLAALALTTREEKRPKHSRILPLFVVCATGAVLIYGTLDMPRFGDPAAPVHQTVAPRYLQSYEETHIPNVVTSVLASFRGYDTLGETAVVFTAGIGVMLLLVRSKRLKQDRKSKNNESEEPAQDNPKKKDPKNHIAENCIL